MSEKYDLTFPQKNIWLLEQFNSNTSINTISATMIFNKIDIELLKKTVNIVIDENDSINIKICLDNGIPKQYIEKKLDLDIEYINYYERTKKDFFNLIKSLTIKPIKIFNNELYYFCIIKRYDGKICLYLKIHHIIADAWALNYICKRICDIYKCLYNNQEIIKDENSYLNYIKSEKEYINSEKYSEDEVFWLNELNNSEKLKIKNYNKIKSYKSNRYSIEIDENLNKKINDFCKENKLSIYSLFMSIISIYFHRLTSQNNFCIATPIFNRRNHKEKNTFGLFVNTMLLKINFNANDTFYDVVENISSRSMKYFRHERYPSFKILEDLYQNRKNKDVPYDLLFSFQNAEIKKDIDLPFDFDVELNYSFYQHEPLMIHIGSFESRGSRRIYYDYITSIFNSREIKDINKRIFYILEQILNNKYIKLIDIDILCKEEKEEILEKFNNTKCLHNNKANIKTLFEKSVENFSNYVAIEFKEQSVTYYELNNYANYLSKILISLGIKKGDIVGICMKRNPKLIASIISIIKCGAVYLPIDPDYPIDRISYMIDNSKTKLIITDDYGNKKIKDNVLNIDKYNYEKENYQNTDVSILPSDLLYVMYTSGSTGKPKAVMIKHESVVNYIESVNRLTDYNNLKNVLSVTTISFDIFVYEIFPTLCLGCKVILADEDEQKMPEKLINLINDKRVEKIQTTPSRFKMMLDICKDKEKFKTIKEVNLGGESFPKKLLSNIRNLLNCNISNCYGPTETTVYSTIKNLTNDKNITVGYPINNTYIYILDKYQKLLPKKCIGEIYIGGLGVANGYLNQKDLTNEKFLNDPFNKGKMYKTGDIGFWNDDGQIECFGRNDSQVKIKGYRIELKEIEKRIISLKNISEAVVIVNEENSKNKYLEAYITLIDAKSSVANIYNQLGKELPNYMLPKNIYIIDKFPLSYNGKIDKKQLINCSNKLLLDKYKAVKYEKPNTIVEKALVNAFSKVLNIRKNKISINDNIFDIGADSILIIQVQLDLLSLGIVFSTQDFYKYNTIKQLAKFKEKKDNIRDNNLTFENNNERKYTITNMFHMENIDISSKDILKNVLLTGATGYLGAHILKSLIEKTNCNIYCLIRKKDNVTVEKRLINKLLYYFDGNYLDLINKRIFIIESNIEEEHLGLDEEKYNQLGKKIDQIIHAAANVNYYGNYSDFKKSNMDTTFNLAKFAIEFGVKYNYVSTLGVSGHFLVDNINKNITFNENTLYIGQRYEQNPYIMTKYLAEKKLYELNDTDNLKLSVIRIGNLTGRYSDGFFQENINDNAFYNILKSMILIKKIPKSMLNREIDFTPVDVCADAIVEFIGLKNSLNKVVHILNYNSITIEKLLTLFKQSSIYIDSISDEEFGKLIYSISKNNIKKDYLRGLINDININKKITFKSKVTIDSSESIKLLDRLGIKFEVLNKDYFSKIINFMKNNNYIKR